MNGYDIDIIKELSSFVSVPLVACGGAGTFDDFKTIIKDVEGVSAGSMFVFYGKNKAVLINFPTNKMKEELSLYKWET